jgi:uncharacterized protein YecE (DUF72 family)
MEVHVGTSGWTYDSWKGTFYPAGLRVADRLAHYAGLFDTVELNASHYRWPKDETMRGYRDRLPDGFTMAVKASRYLSHYRRLRDPKDWCERITQTMDALGPKAGPLLVQLPAGLPRDDALLSAFLERLPERVVVAVEPQHESWLEEGSFDLLDRHGAGFVVSVIAGREPVLRSTGRVAYVRFHNADPRHRYGGSFSDAELDRWPERLATLTAGGRPAFAYFNNDNFGYAPANALTLKGLLDAA